MLFAGPGKPAHVSRIQDPFHQDFLLYLKGKGLDRVDVHGGLEREFDENKNMIGSAQKTEKFHFLPCKIDYDGEARVSDYLIVDAEPDVLQKDQKSLDSFRTTLRGRGLHACDLDLEKRYGYSSIVIEKKGNAVESDWKFDVRASSMLVWNHDQRPSYLNCPVMCLPGWIELANAIHND